jgi:hypothetical protein
MGRYAGMKNICCELVLIVRRPSLLTRISRVPETAVLSLQVYARRPNDEYLGKIRNHIGAFLQGSECRTPPSSCCVITYLCTGFDEQLIVFDKESRRNLKTRLSFRIRQSSTRSQSKDRTPVTVEARPSTPPSRVVQVQAVTPQAEQTFLGDIADTLKPLLSRIDLFVQIGRAFAEVCVCLSHLRTDWLIVRVIGSPVYQDGIHGPDCRLRGLYSHLKLWLQTHRMRRLYGSSTPVMRAFES